MTSIEDIPPDLRHSYARCAEVVKNRARNFYYGLRLTPEPRRSAIYSVYAWMRAADDEADDAGTIDQKRARLLRFRHATEAMLEGRDLGPRENDHAFVAFRHTFRAFNLDPADLRALLDGLDFDLDHEARAAAERATHGDRAQPVVMCPSRQDLQTYCYRVASTVGLVCIKIWGLSDGARWEEARPLAIRRGLAFQLTNILRDFGQDFDEGRIYLPADDFRAAGVNPAELRRWTRPRECDAMVRDLASWARGEYAASQPLDAMVDPMCFATLRTMTRIYSGLLTVVERDPRRIVGGPRIRLQSMHKAGIALRACARAWVNAHVPPTSRLHTVLASRRV
jgi:phytoene synthase